MSDDDLGNVPGDTQVPSVGTPAAPKVVELSAKAAWRQRAMNGERSRWQQLLDGDLSIDDLDDEELAKGRCRDKDGGFSGRPPKMVPRELSDRMRSELLKRGDALFAGAFVQAIEALGAIAASAEAKESDRINAAKYVIERVAGKVPDKVEVRAADPWQQIIDDILVVPDMEAKEPTNNNK